jgi:hypothetical protein
MVIGRKSSVFGRVEVVVHCIKIGAIYTLEINAGSNSRVVSMIWVVQ